MGTNNAINANSAGIVKYDGAGTFSGISVSNHAVLLGSTSNSITSLTPSSSAGYVLTSNGVAADPSFQALPASTGFTQVKIQSFTSSGTYTPTANMKYCVVECVGAGGGGGGTTGRTNGMAPGGGGGAGGYGRKVLSAATVGVSQLVTVGSGGSGGTAGSNGTAGGATSFGSIMTANGGAGGIGALATNGNGGNVATGGAGGTCSGGDVNFTGNSGVSGQGLLFITTVAGEFVCGGMGGASVFGGSAVSVWSNSGSNAINGNAGTTPGAGGGGAISSKTTSSATGGTGASGICIVTEFI